MVRGDFFEEPLYRLDLDPVSFMFWSDLTVYGLSFIHEFLANLYRFPVFSDTLPGCDRFRSCQTRSIIYYYDSLILGNLFHP